MRHQLLIAGLCCGLVSCGSVDDGPSSATGASAFPNAAQTGERTLRLATTTSTENSGLLGALLPSFEKSTGIGVQVIAVGTGKAIKMGELGDVDVILVHAREKEDEFVAQGFGTERRDVMYNDFVIVGPASDPAKTASTRDAAKAFEKIAEAKQIFVSRGDQSGTHIKELSLWSDAGGVPSGEWYREIGQGMDKALQIANELGAYVLTDRGTWLSRPRGDRLRVLVEGDRRLFNPYGVIAVNPAKHPDAHYSEAMKLVDFLTSPDGQARIGAFRVNGEPLFTPSAKLSHGTATKPAAPRTPTDMTGRVAL